MGHNPEVPECGLIVPDSKMNPGTVCKDCGKPFACWPVRDWMCCTRCLTGCSRLDMAKPSWEESLDTDTSSIVAAYRNNTLVPRAKAKAIWRRLEAGSLLKTLWPRGERMSRFLRVLSQPADLAALQELSQSELKISALPVLVMRLDDLPGRMTGLAVLWRSRNGKENFQIVRATDGPKVGFLDLYKERQVALEQPFDVLRMQSWAYSQSDDPLPVILVDTTEKVWQPSVKIHTILACNSLTADRLKSIARSHCHLWLPPTGQRGTWHPTAATSGQTWAKIVCESSEWQSAVAAELTRLGDDAAARLLVEAGLSQDQVESILQHCHQEARSGIRQAMTFRPLCCTLSNKRMVMDDGASWTDPSGKMILSVSFQVLSVKRLPTGKVQYSCRVQDGVRCIDFAVGQELERDAFSVIMRECLMHGLTVGYNRSYSKHAIEIAVRLRPVERQAD